MLETAILELSLAKSIGAADDLLSGRIGGWRVVDVNRWRARNEAGVNS
ncbi:hypothetical protein [Kushneria phyllosphaerae]|nr:hypothetical protein [Kushneria phyllosphaerae]